MSNSAGQGFRNFFPNVGVEYGIDLANECLSGSVLPAANTSVLSFANLNPSVMQMATVPLTAANLTGMYAAPVTVLAAPAAGTNILQAALLRFTKTSTAFASGGAISLIYGTAGVAITGTIAATFLTTPAAAVTDAVFQPLTALESLQLDTMAITNATGGFTTGTGTAVLYLFYQNI